MGSWVLGLYVCVLKVFVFYFCGTRLVANRLLCWTMVRLLITHWVWGILAYMHSIYALQVFVLLIFGSLKCYLFDSVCISQVYGG